MAAGGSGSRARSSSNEPPKQLRSLAGRPLIRWSADALIDAGCAPVIVAAPVELIARIEELLAGSPVEVVPGGSTRQDSVATALERVDQDRVVVHDAARPFVTTELVISVLEALERADASMTAVPVDETLKHRNNEAIETIDRAGMWRAQTPQAFRTEVLKSAHAEARRTGFAGTDDAQLVERLGGSVVIVEGTPLNLKLTIPEDFVLAEAIVASRS